MLFTFVLFSFAFADVVLLRNKHGRGVERHSDVISCVYMTDDNEALFSPERLLEHVVLPDALWCDATNYCHDSTSGQEYKAMSLVCNDEVGAPIRCSVKIDCADLILAFWRSLIATIACIIAFIIIPGLCFDNRRVRMLEYDKDTSL